MSDKTIAVLVNLSITVLVATVAVIFGILAAAMVGVL